VLRNVRAGGGAADGGARNAGAQSSSHPWIHHSPVVGGESVSEISAVRGVKSGRADVLARSMAHRASRSPPAILVHVVSPGIVMAGMARKQLDRSPLSPTWRRGVIPLFEFVTPPSRREKDRVPLLTRRRLHDGLRKVLLVDVRRPPLSFPFAPSMELLDAPSHRRPRSAGGRSNLFLSSSSGERKLLLSRAARRPSAESILPYLDSLDLAA